MLNKKLLISIILFFLVIFFSALFIVKQTEQALVLQFGDPIKVIKKPRIENLWINPPAISSLPKKLDLCWAVDFNPTIFFPVINCKITSKEINDEQIKHEIKNFLRFMWSLINAYLTTNNKIKNLRKIIDL